MPEAVLLTYDQFEDLGGELKFDHRAGVVAKKSVAAELRRADDELP